MPCLADSVITTINGPRMTIQCCVQDDNVSSNNNRTIAPTTLPISEFIPPRMIMTSRSPERVHDMYSGEANFVRFASSMPATPQTIAEMT